MLHWFNAKAAAWAAGLFVLCCPVLSWAGGCDEYDPFGPARSTKVTLNARDLFEEDGPELRSFIETGSVGKVDVAIVSSSPRGTVEDVSAVPQVSRLSPNYGEELKGIAVAVAIRKGARTPQVVLNLRQVCARHFRNTFLYE